MKNKELKAYPYFNEDTLPIRKAYNRFVTGKTILNNHGSVLAERYLDSFSKEDKAKIAVIAAHIKMSGIEETKKLVISEQNKAEGNG